MILSGVGYRSTLSGAISESRQSPRENVITVVQYIKYDLLYPGSHQVSAFLPFYLAITQILFDGMAMF